MTDMDLREVLAESPCLRGPDDPFNCRWMDEKHPECLLARLSRPDVLDEFEQRCVTWLGGHESPVARATRARAILSDMLGGGS